MQTDSKAPAEQEQMSLSPIRLPVSLKQWLQQKAIKNRRSFNSEAVVIFEQLREQETTHATQAH
ncbi:MAG: hypothetical protein Q8M05_13170 [Rhodoferax sp.]|uniref:hypothetical protein n=1 Tax=Rhodoferax sp. TaxID=50421 RepID=UPI002731027B|nr:hypothetical protein [Rhodoferax sp.]MDP1530326.1 hypothetical protein [Rhodoferax sp.]MDP1943328.1 hypothetical protein [Rhodoferax sp.]